MKVAAINDLSGFGKCSLVADITVLSAMGIQCCPLPTAVLSAQTGYPSYYSRELTGIISEYSREWKKQKEVFNGIITGFMMSSKEALSSLEFIREFKTDDNLVLVDPVMGDDGRTYRNFSKELLEAIKEMVKEADIITPNLTELFLLAGEDPGRILSLKGDELLDEVFRLSMAVGGDGGKTVVVTGIPVQDGSLVGNFVLAKGQTKFISSKSNGVHYSGTGDLFAAALLGSILLGKDAFTAADVSSRFIYASVLATPKGTDPNAGACYEENLRMLMS